LSLQQNTTWANSNCSYLRWSKYR